MQKILALLFCVGLACPAAAINKCTLADGKVIYSDMPCPGGKAQQKDGEKWVDTAELQRRAAEELRQRKEAERKAEEEQQRRQEAEQKRRDIIDAANARQQREQDAEYKRQRAAIEKTSAVTGLYVVDYIVEGTASSAGLTYRNSTGGTEQHHVALPWRMTMSANRKAFVYLSAQNRTDRGAVSVKILINGITVKSSESSAEYGIATASGRI